MKIIKNLNTNLNNIKLNNILFVDNEYINREYILDISQKIPEIYISFSNNFLFRQYFIKFRLNKNVKILQTSSIPVLNYEAICFSKYDDKIKILLSSIKFIKYLFLFPVNNNLIDIPGFTRINEVLYKKNNEIIATDITFSNSTKKILKINKEVNFKNKLNEEFKFIKLVNIVSNNNDFSQFNQGFCFKIDGLLNILCNISSIDDYNIFIKVKKYVIKNYKFSKFIIILNGISINIFNMYELTNIKYDILIFNEYKSINMCDKIFKNLINGSYVYNMLNISLKMMDEIIINEN